MFKLKVIQAEFGDCFVLEYGTEQLPRYMLIDGGPKNTYAASLKGELEAIGKGGGKVDLLVLSHVDEDHIMGVLDLLGELRLPAAGERLALQVDALWHNTFSETLGKKVENRFRNLIQERNLTRAGLFDETERQTDFAFRSIAQGEDLTLAAQALSIPLNPHFTSHGLICVDKMPAPIELDNVKVTIVGPTLKNLENLRKKWIEWLNKRRKSLQIEDPAEAKRAAAALDRSVPNLSSLMFLVEGEDKKILFTGDGRGDHLLQGLEKAGLLDENGTLHVDLLKVPHHGSARNVTQAFFRKVTADQYLISANGKHGNPDLPTLHAIAEAARLQNRSIELILTNETETVQEFARTHNPDRYKYRLTFLPKNAPAGVIDLKTAQFTVIPAKEKSISVSAALTSGKPIAKKALLVGINNFIRPSWALRGCINDTQEIHSLLTGCFGFEDEGIRVLHDREARYEDIRQGLDWLLSDYTGSDVRVLHFSSHGSQVDDDGDDEWEALDEVLIPYDHDWEKPFRDDEIRAVINQVPEHVNFTFIADCCHSGSIQKALLDEEYDFRPRFITPPPEILDRIEQRKIERDLEADVYAAQKLQEMLDEVPKSEWAVKIPEFLSFLRRRFRENRFGIVENEKHILLAGCEDRQTSADAFIEGSYRGAFTWGLCKAIRETNGNLTYEDLLRRASRHMSNFEQKPQLECPPLLRKAQIFAPLPS